MCVIKCLSEQLSLFVKKKKKKDWFNMSAHLLKQQVALTFRDDN